MPHPAGQAARADSQGLLPFAAAAFTFLVAMMGTTLPTPLYTLYEQQMDLSQAMVTVIYAVYAAGVIGALLVTGNWSDQIGRKPLLWSGLVLGLISDAVFATAGNLTMILLGRVLSGLSAGLFASTATAAVIELMPEDKRRIGVLTATAVNMGGLGLGPNLAGVLAQWSSAPTLEPYLAHGVLILLAGGLFLTVPEMVSRKDNPDFSPQKPALPSEVRPVFIPAAIGAFAGFMVTGYYSAVVPSFLGQQMGYHSAALVGFVAGLLFLCSTVGQIFVDRLPAERRMPVGITVLGAGVLVIAAGLWVESLAILLLGTVIAGLGHGLAFRGGMGSVGAEAPENQRAAVIALYFVVAYIAISIPVVLVGALTPVLAIKPLSIGFALVSALLCGLALVLLKRRA